MPAILSSIFAIRCRGPQPVRAIAEPELFGGRKKGVGNEGVIIRL